MPSDHKAPDDASRCTDLPPVVPASLRRLFLDTMNCDLAELEQSIARRDAQATRHVLHRIRGGLAMVKITTILENFDAFDTQVKRDGWSDHAFQRASGLMLELREFLIQV